MYTNGRLREKWRYTRSAVRKDVGADPCVCPRIGRLRTLLCVHIAWISYDLEGGSGGMSVSLKSDVVVGRVEVACAPPVLEGIARPEGIIFPIFGQIPATAT